MYSKGWERQKGSLLFWFMRVWCVFFVPRISLCLLCILKALSTEIKTFRRSNSLVFVELLHVRKNMSSFHWCLVYSANQWKCSKKTQSRFFVHQTPRSSFKEVLIYHAINTLVCLTHVCMGFETHLAWENSKLLQLNLSKSLLWYKEYTYNWEAW